MVSVVSSVCGCCVRGVTAYCGEWNRVRGTVENENGKLGKFEMNFAKRAMENERSPFVVIYGWHWLDGRLMGR